MLMMGGLVNHTLRGQRLGKRAMRLHSGGSMATKDRADAAAADTATVDDEAETEISWNDDNVAVIYLQFVVKGALAVLGFHCLLTTPLGWDTDGNVSQEAYVHGPLALRLFLVTTATDLAMHGCGCDPSAITENIHHLTQTCLILCCFYSDRTYVYMSLCGVIETVGPVYQCIKLNRLFTRRSSGYAPWIASDTLRLLAIAVNVLIRETFFIWIVVTGTIPDLAAVLLDDAATRDPTHQVGVLPESLLTLSVPVLIAMDVIWSRGMWRRYVLNRRRQKAA